MASKVVKKNAKLKFLYRQSRYLTPAYKRVLYNALNQPHFDYGCSSWFPLFSFLIQINSMQDLTDITRHGVTRKRNTKRLRHTGILALKPLRS